MGHDVRRGPALPALRRRVEALHVVVPAGQTARPLRGNHGAAVGIEAQIAHGSTSTAIRSLDSVERSLLRASRIESARLSRYVPFLATTAAATPFIGLFGTVWGIMDSFASIGSMGTTSITAVAPGISEALINTAAGLFAAIPALLAYNAFVNRLRLARGEMEDFTLEFLNLTERNFM